jgi:lysophospholipid acyltransferase (LPLAT)-like uncharacterized protein
MKFIFKKFLKTWVGQWFLALLIDFYIVLVRLTCRFHFQNFQTVQTLKDENKPFIIAIWHGRLLMMPYLFPKKTKARAIISDHSDGRIVKFAAKLFGYQTIVGSSTKGGIRAFKEMIATLKSGESLFITPDGPKGPRGTFQAGAAEASRMTGAPLIPVSVSGNPAKFFRSWDKFMLPQLFSDIYIHYHDPLHIHKSASETERELFYQDCEDALNKVEREADKAAGVCLETIAKQRQAA